MNGLIIAGLVWAIIFLLMKALQQYSQKNQVSFSVRKRKIINALLIAFAAVITVFEIMNPTIETMLQPPDISPYNYEEVYNPPVEIEMRVHGIFQSIQLPFLDIYYTTDGSDPSNSESAIKYNEPFYIQESTSFSARCRIFWFFWGDLLSPSPYYQIASESEEFIAVEGIKAEGPLSMYVGEYKTMGAVVLPENATDKKVYWVSSNPDIATIDSQSGTVHAISPSKGPIEITAKTNSGQFSATIKLTIQEKQKESLTRPETKEPTNGTSPAGTIRPTGTTDSPSTTPPSKGTGSSETTNPSGAADSSESSSFGVSIEPSSPVFGCINIQDILHPIFPSKTLDSIEILPGNISIKEGESILLELVSYPPDIDIDYIEWEVQDDNIAHITGAGRVIGISAGTTRITATVEDCCAIAYVEVQPAVIEVTDVSVHPRFITLQAYGDSEYANAWVLPTNATEQRLHWYSENEEIVQVDSDGLLTPGISGITTVYVTDWFGQYSCPIEVEVISSQSLDDYPPIPWIVQPSISVSTDCALVPVDGFVDISFNFTTPDYYSEISIAYTTYPDDYYFTPFGSGPFFTYNEYVTGYRSVRICPQDYGLLPGSYTFRVSLCESDEYGNSIPLASDTFEIVVY